MSKSIKVTKRELNTRVENNKTKEMESMSYSEVVILNSINKEQGFSIAELLGKAEGGTQVLLKSEYDKREARRLAAQEEEKAKDKNIKEAELSREERAAEFKQRLEDDQSEKEARKSRRIRQREEAEIRLASLRAREEARRLESEARQLKHSRRKGTDKTDPTPKNKKQRREMIDLNIKFKTPSLKNSIERVMATQPLNYYMEKRFIRAWEAMTSEPTLTHSELSNKEVFKMVEEINALTEDTMSDVIANHTKLDDGDLSPTVNFVGLNLRVKDKDLLVNQELVSQRLGLAKEEDLTPYSTYFKADNKQEILPVESFTDMLIQVDISTQLESDAQTMSSKEHSRLAINTFAERMSLIGVKFDGAKLSDIRTLKVNDDKTVNVYELIDIKEEEKRKRAKNESKALRNNNYLTKDGYSVADSLEQVEEAGYKVYILGAVSPSSLRTGTAMFYDLSRFYTFLDKITFGASTIMLNKGEQTVNNAQKGISRLAQGHPSMVLTNPTISTTAYVADKISNDEGDYLDGKSWISTSGFVKALAGCGYELSEKDVTGTVLQCRPYSVNKVSSDVVASSFITEILLQLSDRSVYVINQGAVSEKDQELFNGLFERGENELRGRVVIITSDDEILSLGEGIIKDEESVEFILNKVEFATDLNGLKASYDLSRPSGYNVLAIDKPKQTGYAFMDSQSEAAFIFNNREKAKDVLTDLAIKGLEDIIADMNDVTPSVPSMDMFEDITYTTEILDKIAPVVVKNNKNMFIEKSRQYLDMVTKYCTRHNYKVKGANTVIQPDIAEIFGKRFIFDDEVYYPGLEDLCRRHDERFMEAVIVRNPAPVGYMYLKKSLLTFNRLRARINGSDLSESIKAELIRYYSNASKNVLFLPANEEVKDILAGADFDFDTAKLFVEKSLVDLVDDSKSIAYRNVSKMTINESMTNMGNHDIFSEMFYKSINTGNDSIADITLVATGIHALRDGLLNCNTDIEKEFAQKRLNEVLNSICDYNSSLKFGGGYTRYHELKDGVIEVAVDDESIMNFKEHVASSTFNTYEEVSDLVEDILAILVIQQGEVIDSAKTGTILMPLFSDTDKAKQACRELYRAKVSYEINPLYTREPKENQEEQHKLELAKAKNSGNVQTVYEEGMPIRKVFFSNNAVVKFSIPGGPTFSPCTKGKITRDIAVYALENIIPLIDEKVYNMADNRNAAYKKLVNAVMHDENLESADYTGRLVERKIKGQTVIVKETRHLGLDRSYAEFGYSRSSMSVGVKNFIKNIKSSYHDVLTSDMSSPQKKEFFQVLGNMVKIKLYQVQEAFQGRISLAGITEAASDYSNMASKLYPAEYIRFVCEIDNEDIIDFAGEKLTVVKGILNDGDQLQLVNGISDKAFAVCEKPLNGVYTVRVVDGVYYATTKITDIIGTREGISSRVAYSIYDGYTSFGKQYDKMEAMTKMVKTASDHVVYTNKYLEGADDFGNRSFDQTNLVTVNADTGEVISKVSTVSHHPGVMFGSNFHTDFGFAKTYEVNGIQRAKALIIGRIEQLPKKLTSNQTTLNNIKTTRR